MALQQAKFLLFLRYKRCCLKGAGLHPASATIMHLKYALLLGFLIWGVMFLFVAVLEALEVFKLGWVQFLTVAVCGLLSYECSARVKPDKFLLALGYAALWLAINSLFYLLATKGFHSEIFNFKILMGYNILLLFGPLYWGFVHRAARPPRLYPHHEGGGTDTWL